MRPSQILLKALLDFKETRELTGHVSNLQNKFLLLLKSLTLNEIMLDCQ